MGTSQPKIARIESGEENITLRTLERLCSALNGRLRLAVEPAEVHFPRIERPWWDEIFDGLAAKEEWKVAFAFVDETAGGARFAAGWTSRAKVPILREDRALPSSTGETAVNRQSTTLEGESIAALV